MLLVLAGAAACPYTGHYLILDDPPSKADAIVVLAGARAERWLEGVDLYREGFAPVVVLSPGIVEPAEERLRSMGVRYPTDIELARDTMTQLGVAPSAITVLPGPVDNTADEAEAARDVARGHGWTRLLVVTSKYHTRRTRFAFERALRGTGVAVEVVASRHDVVQADRWWTSRADLRYVISELQKLLAYRLGLDR